MIIDFLFTKTPLFFLTQSFWRDEAFSYFMAKENILNIFYLSSKDFTPPLYSLILKFWIYIFGPTEIAIRSLSLFLYLILLYFFYLFLKNILKIKKYWIYFYLFLFITNPMLHYYAFEARAYSLFALLSFMSVYYFIQRDWKKFFFISIFGLYSHYFMLLVLFIEGLFVIFNRKNIKKSFIELSKPLIFFIPWILYVFINRNPLNESFWIKDLEKNILIYVPIILYSGYEKAFWYAKEIALKLNSLIILFFLAGILNFQKIKSNVFFLISLWVLVPSIVILIVSFYKPLFFPRYLILSTPALILLLISIIDKLNIPLKYLSILLILIFTLNYTNIQIKYNHKAPFKKIISQIKSEAKKNDLLYVESELDYHIAKYYFLKNNVFIYGKNYEDIPNFTGKVIIPKESVTYSLPKFPVKAFILHNDLTYDIQSSY